MEHLDLAIRTSSEGFWGFTPPPDKPLSSPQTPAWYSGRYEELLGYNEHELDKVLESWTSRLHPEDKEQTLAALSAHLERKEPYTVEYRLQTKQGEYRWFSSRGQAIWDADGHVVHMAGSLQDITHRRRLEEALNESQARYRSLVEHAPIGIGIHELDLNGCVVSMNSAGRQILSPSGDADLTGRAFLDVVAAEDRERVGSLVARACHGLPSEFEFRTARQDMQRILISGFVPLRDRSGRTLKILGIIKDITERKNALTQLNIAYDRLRELTRRLKAAEEEERRRIALELHDEFGQTLSGLKFDLAWLRKQLRSKSGRAPVKALQDRVGTMTTLVEQMIQSVRRIATLLRPSILDDLGLVAALEWQARDFQDRTGVRCDLRVSPQIAERPLDMQTSTALFRIAQELLTNVARHAKASTMSLSLEETDGTLTLKAEDDGRGIPEGVEGRTSSLGLLGIRERVSLLGGACSIEAEPNKGTRVAVQIPLHEEGAKDPLPVS